MDDLTPTVLARLCEISVPYASQVLSGARDLPRELAVRIYRETGHKLGPLIDATETEIVALERIPLRVRLNTEPKAA
jgi:hypothetical protein